MAVQLKELGSKLSYQEVNDILKLYPSAAEPASPYTGQVWLDTSSGAVLKRYNGSGWDIVGEVTAANLLTLIKNVDGSGSGLDADKLDGQEGSFYRNASNLNAGTVPSARLSASDLMTLVQTVDGSGSGLDADKLDGQEGSFYRNASNLNAGTVPLAQIPAALTGKSADQLDGLDSTQFIRSDADTDVSAHTEWQDNYKIRIGTGGDFQFLHDGSNSYIDNYTGQLFIRQLLHGGNIYLQAENDSGTRLYMVTVDPDFPKVQIGGAVETRMHELTLENNEIFDTGIPRASVGYFFVQNSQGGAANGCFFWVGCILTANNGVSRSGGSTSIWGDTKDEAGLINVYCESTGNLKVQNLSGASKILKMGFIGVNI